MDRFETIFMVAMILCAITTGTAVGLYIGKNLDCPPTLDAIIKTVEKTCSDGSRPVCVNKYV